MRKFQILAFLILTLAGTVAGQCPGPAVRTALLNLQKAVSNPTFYTAQNSLAGQVPVSDTCGNLRYTRYVVISDTCLSANPFGPVVGLPPSTFIKICGTDSLFYIDWRREPLFLGVTAGSAADSINWYNSNDTTTSLLRTAYILKSAEWVGIDPTGFARIIIGDLAYGQVYADANEATIDHLDATGQSVVRTNTAGVEITTSQSASRAVTIRTDTVNTAGSFDPTNFRLNFNSDFNYLYADSLTVLALGQFPAFPALVFDGTEKGFFYDLNNFGVGAIAGNGTTGSFSDLYLSENEFNIDVYNGQNVNSQFSAAPTQTQIIISSGNTLSAQNAIITEINQSATTNLFNVRFNETDTNALAVNYMGESAANTYYAGHRAYGIRTFEGIRPFDWIQSYLPNDTTSQTVSFYNRAYYFPNARPNNTLNDTSVIVWIGDGTNAGKHPQFVPLPGAGSTVNWYNSNGTTTDNTRIADVTETATWRSDNVTFDGIVPFRFEIAGVGANEPENMVWAFPSGDSAVIRQADQEIVLFSNNNWLLYSDAQVNFQADSIGFSSNLSDGAWKTGRYGVVTQNTIHRDATETTISTGTTQTELFLDGFGGSAVWVVPAGSATNFKIHLTAYCSSAGNGAGINTGDSFVGWYLGGIKRVGSTTSLIGTVQNAATAQSDAGMSTSVVTIDADDTDESLRIQFTPPSTAGTTTVIAVKASIEILQ